jgi:hypothetical protein
MMQDLELQDLEQTIRERAYQLWIDGGYRDGEADSHWLAAQREVLSGALGEIGRVSKEVSPAVRKPKKSAAGKKRRPDVPPSQARASSDSKSVSWRHSHFGLHDFPLRVG